MPGDETSYRAMSLLLAATEDELNRTKGQRDELLAKVKLLEDPEEHWLRYGANFESENNKLGAEVERLKGKLKGLRYMVASARDGCAGPHPCTRDVASLQWIIDMIDIEQPWEKKGVP
jgi:hypothetical protein